MYLKVALRISELESTDNLSPQYSIISSNGAFERFGKPDLERFGKFFKDLRALFKHGHIEIKMDYKYLIFLINLLS